ncbi:dethiobiotin synthase [Candidatus Omnitrophota bacterium]
MSKVKGFFVTGTDTGVGKTEVASYLARRFLLKGFSVAVMKPVATGVKKFCEDARILKTYSCSKEPLGHINPISLKLPLAPLVASEIQKKKIDTNIIWKHFKRLKSDNDLVIVEGIGGIMVPISRKGKKTFYVLDLILKMALPVIVVARPNLGTINHTLMTVNLLKDKNIKVSGIIFNYTSPVKQDLSIKTNPAMIERLSGVKVLGIMYYSKNRNKRRMRWLRKTGF